MQASDRLRGGRSLRMKDLTSSARPAAPAQPAWKARWPDSVTAPSGLRESPLRAAVDLRAVVNIEDVDNAAGLVDPVDDAIGAAPSTVTTGERPEQRPADPVRVDRKRGIAELKHGCGDGFRKPLGDRPPCGRLETDLVPLRGFGRHAPVTRRRARSWRTVAMSAPGSPRPRAARLSEMRATASVSPRISRVI